MRPLAYNILPPNYSSLIEAPDPAWNLVPAGAVIPIYDPRWYSQSRGIPTLCHGILDWYDVGEIRDSTKTTVKALSRVTMMEYNETGRADPGAGPHGQPRQRRPHPDRPPLQVPRIRTDPVFQSPTPANKLRRPFPTISPPRLGRGSSTTSPGALTGAWIGRSRCTT